MGFQKGHKKTGGRKKGVIPKKILLLNTFAKAVVEGGMDKFITELKKLNGRDYVTSFLTIFEYVQPKLARTELTGKDGKDLFIPITQIEIVHTQEIPLNGNGAIDSPTAPVN